MLPLPDLLHRRARAAVDPELIRELLDTTFLGAEPETALPAGEAAEQIEASPWDPGSFREDLFVDELLEDAFSLVWEGRRYPVHRGFLRRVLTRPPGDADTVVFRQEILRELETDAALRERVWKLYRDLFTLLSLLKSPRSAQLDPREFRLEVLETARAIVADMVGGFRDARSGLARLHQGGLDIRSSGEYKLLDALLDYDGHLARLSVRLRVGADGSLKDLAVMRLAENRKNPLYRSPLRRWGDRLRLLWRGYPLSSREVTNRLILEVYLEVAPALRTLLQVMGHLEVYLAALSFREWAARRNLAVCLPEVAPDVPLRLDGLFNPLLVRQGILPVPCRLATTGRTGVLIVTGPNSGGKTRMLQALGLAQMLGQSGLYVPAARARLPPVPGLFASVLDREDAGQVEGRLGSELLRIRELFEGARPGSLVILDELCSGTNPSEAVEIFSMVLELLEGLAPLAFISTHFLDFARELEARPPVRDLEFLQVEIAADQTSTYQFVPGVAATSMAAGTARRLGVSRDELAALIEDRRRG
jgi:DNA mismatch repair protein MutS2